MTSEQLTSRRVLDEAAPDVDPRAQPVPARRNEVEFAVGVQVGRVDLGYRIELSKP